MKLTDLLPAFERLSLREKLLVGFGVLSLPGFLIYQFLLLPATVSQASLEKRLAQSRAESAQLTLQVSTMENELHAKDAAGKNRLDGLNRDLVLQEKRFSDIVQRMVLARDMPQLLQSLLKKRPGLQLAYLRSRAPEPVRPPAEGKPATAAGNPDQPVIGAEEMYLHGVDLALEGSYADLLACVSDLEKMPQKMLWAGMTLRVQEYPRATLELKLQTLSREKTWLEL